MNRKALPMVLAIFLLSTLALAGRSYLGSYAGTTTAPSTATAGYAVPFPGQTKGLTVTVSDVRDGSVGDGLDQVLSFDAYAWCYNPDTDGTASLGGAEPGWARAPALDLNFRITDAGAVAGDGRHSAQTATATVTTGIDCTRVYYTTSANEAWDAGTLVHRVTLTSQQ